MVEYDKIAKKYVDANKRLGKTYIHNPSLIKAMGNVVGKNVLDLGCGDGYFTREIKSFGAQKVVGVDISSEMIRLAKQKEKENPVGIKYEIGDVICLDKLGDFDLVVGGFLLHYSKTKEELFGMCKSIYKNLKEGGRFVTINNHPETPLMNHKEYGATSEINERLEEGKVLKITLWDGDKEVCSFNTYHWLRNTYEKALKEAGFKDIKWIDLKVSDEGIKRFGKEFWRGWDENHYLIIIEATK